MWAARENKLLILYAACYYCAYISQTVGFQWKHKTYKSHDRWNGIQLYTAFVEWQLLNDSFNELIGLLTITALQLFIFFRFSFGTIYWDTFCNYMKTDNKFPLMFLKRPRKTKLEHEDSLPCRNMYNNYEMKQYKKTIPHTSTHKHTCTFNVDLLNSGWVVNSVIKTN